MNAKARGGRAKEWSHEQRGTDDGPPPHCSRPEQERTNKAGRAGKHGNRMVAPGSSAVVLPGVVAQLEQLLGAAQTKLEAEEQRARFRSEYARILDMCPIVAQLASLKPDLCNMSATLDMRLCEADTGWRSTIQEVLKPSGDATNTNQLACAALQSIPSELGAARFSWLQSIAARADQVWQIFIKWPSTAALEPQRLAGLCDACFSIARCVQLDEVDASRCIVNRSAAMHALSRELAAPCYPQIAEFEFTRLSCSRAGFNNGRATTGATWRASALSELDTDRRGRAFVKTKFVIVNLSQTRSMRLEQLRICDGTEGGTHTIDLTNTGGAVSAVLLPHTKPKPSYSVYVLLAPLSQLHPTQLQCDTGGSPGDADAVAWQICSRFAVRGMRQRFKPRFPKYSFTWRFQELEMPNLTTASAIAPWPGLWERLGF